MTKRLLTFLLAFVLLFGMFPVTEVSAYNSAYAIPDLTGDKAADTARIAQSQVGYTYSDGTVYGAWWNSVTNWGIDYTYMPWCGMFACWCAYQAGAGMNVAYDINGASSSRLFDWLKANGSFDTGFSTSPKPGDFIFFGYGNDSVDHVAVVTGYDPATKEVYFVGGNQSDAVKSDSCKWEANSLWDVYSGLYVLGYGRPNYAAEDTAKPGKPVLSYSVSKNTVSFTWASTSNTTHYDLLLQKKNAAGNWESFEQISNAGSGVSRTLQEGEYRALLTACNSNASVSESDAVTFMVGFYAEGACGEDARWSMEYGVLTVTGTGAMADFSDATAPWYGFHDQIREVVIDSGITSISSRSFKDCPNLYSVCIADSVTYVGQQAFDGCGNLHTVSYEGSILRWRKITFATGNDMLLKANIVFSVLPTLVKANGVWKCMVDGEVYTDNTLISYNGNLYHVKGGQWVKDTGFVKYNGKSYYVVNGVWNKATTLVRISNGSYVYVKDGIHTRDTTLVKYDGRWLYVKDGVFTKETGCVKYNGSLYYVVNGQWSKATTGLIKVSEGNWVYVKDGVQDMSNTLVKHNGSWYHVNGGKWVKDTTLVKYDGRWLYIKNGVYTKTTAFVKYNGSAYYVVNGQWSKGTTGLIKISDGSWVCVKNGVQDMSNTLFKYNDNWYHVSGGKWVRDTTLVQRNGATYYVKNGVVDFGFTGRFQYNGKTYNIVKGVVK